MKCAVCSHGCGMVGVTRKWGKWFCSRKCFIAYRAAWWKGFWARILRVLPT